MTRALLFSNSANHDGTFLSHARETVADFFAETRELLFIPWALADHDSYTGQVSAAFGAYGIRVRSAHSVGDVAAAVRDAGAMYVGGGNTFRLVQALRRAQLMPVMREAVERGLLYSGASAGSLIASPTMRTTNDMPIVQPESLDTLALLPFQLNCHYEDADPTSTHAGETRELRIREFHEENDVAVLGIREGTWLHIDDATGSTTMTLSGTAVSRQAPGPGILHERGIDPVEVAGDLTRLLAATPRFDLQT